MSNYLIFYSLIYDNCGEFLRILILYNPFHIFLRPGKQVYSSKSREIVYFISVQFRFSFYKGRGFSYSFQYSSYPTRIVVINKIRIIKLNTRGRRSVRISFAFLLSLLWFLFLQFLSAWHQVCAWSPGILKCGFNQVVSQAKIFNINSNDCVINISDYTR